MIPFLMRRLLLICLSVAGLLLTLVPAVLVAAGHIALETHHLWTFAGTLLWFLTAPFWMNRQAT